MKRLFNKGQKGFTLIELLVVIAILGVLAVVAVPNVASLMGPSSPANLAAANIEAATVQTAVDIAIATASPQMTAAQITALTQASAAVTPYLRGAIKGTYTVAADGSVTGTGGWGTFTWDATNHVWKK